MLCATAGRSDQDRNIHWNGTLDGDWEWSGGEGGANLTCSESHRAPHAWPETWVGRRYTESGVLQANACTCGTTALKDDVGCGPPSDESCDEAPL